MKARSTGLGLLSIGIAMMLLIGWPATISSILAGGRYSDSGQTLGGASTYDVALGDLDGDGAPDGFAANDDNNRVWLNDENGYYMAGELPPDNRDSRGVALGDLDGDGDLDAFVANHDGDNQVLLNDGNGLFSQTGQVMNASAMSFDVVLGDFDSDDDLDAFVANDGENMVWFNNGSATFGAGQSLGDKASHEAVVADVDGDDDLDVYVANGSSGAEEDELWLNDGNGTFTASGQTLSAAWNESVALADLDGDDDVDLFLAAWFGDDSVWLNDGDGNFSDTGQALSGNSSTDVALVDVDGDGDLDAIVAKWTPEANEIWLNDGAGNFTPDSESLDDSATYEVAVSDLDGDGDADLFFGNFGANHVWFRGGTPLPAARFDVDAHANDAGRIVFPWARTGDARLPIKLSFAPATPLNVQAQIDAGDDVSTVTIPFSAGQIKDNLDVANPRPDPSATVTLTLSVESPQAALPDGLHNPLNLVFVDGDQGDRACSLCFVDWLLKLLGFDTSFWTLHHMELAELRATSSWNYYHGLFAANSQELTQIIAHNPTLLWQTFEALETWTPAVASYDSGMGASVTVTGVMVDQAVQALEGIGNAAAPDLAQRIESELEALDPTSWPGKSMDEVMDVIGDRAQEQLFLPVISGAGSP